MRVISFTYIGVLCFNHTTLLSVGSFWYAATLHLLKSENKNMLYRYVAYLHYPMQLETLAGLAPISPVVTPHYELHLVSKIGILAYPYP